MVVRKRKRSNKKRGGRTQHGNTKNWRGGGSRGGRGRAGSHKHKYSKYYSSFGVKIRLKSKHPPARAINFSELNKLVPNWLEKGLCEKDAEGKIIVDGKKVGINKVLGGGVPDHEFVFKNVTLSKKGQDKLEGLDSEFERVEESESEREA